MLGRVVANPTVGKQKYTCYTKRVKAGRGRKKVVRIYCARADYPAKVGARGGKRTRRSPYRGGRRCRTKTGRFTKCRGRKRARK